MTGTTEPRPLPEAIKAHPERYVFLENAVLDSLVSTVMELSAQVWTMKRRTLITEKLLDTKGVCTVEEIETFVASAEDKADWQAERDRFVKGIYAPFARATVPDDREPPSVFLKR